MNHLDSWRAARARQVGNAGRVRVMIALFFVTSITKTKLLGYNKQWDYETKLIFGLFETKEVYLVMLRISSTTLNKTLLHTLIVTKYAS